MHCRHVNLLNILYVDSRGDVALNGCLVFVNGSSVAGTMVRVPLREHNRWLDTHGCRAAAAGALRQITTRSQYVGPTQSSLHVRLAVEGSKCASE